MNEPLAQRLRPKTLADVCGQQHLLAPGRVFRRTIESGRIMNFWRELQDLRIKITQKPAGWTGNGHRYQAAELR